MPPTELTEGYGYELVAQNHTLADGKRRLHVNYVQPLEEAEGMLMVMLPDEKLLIQADLVDTHEGLPETPTKGAKAMYDMVEALDYRLDRVVPIHGPPVAWSAFLSRTGVDRPAVANAGLGLDSTIERIAADPNGKAILDTRIPGLTSHPDYPSFKAQTLPALAPVSGGQISSAQLALVKADLEQLAKRRPQGAIR